MTKREEYHYDYRTLAQGLTVSCSKILFGTIKI